MFLKILAFVFLVPAFGLVFAARNLVERFGLDKKVKCSFEHEMNEEELSQYCFNRAMVNLKMLGLLLSIPGLVLIVVAFR